MDTKTYTGGALRVFRLVILILSLLAQSPMMALADCGAPRLISGSCGVDSQQSAVISGFARSSCAPTDIEPTALWTFVVPAPGASVSLMASIDSADEFSFSVRRCCSDNSTEIICKFPGSPSMITLPNLTPGSYTVVAQGLFTHEVTLQWMSSAPLANVAMEGCGSCGARRVIGGSSGFDLAQTVTSNGFPKSNCAPTAGEPVALWSFTVPEGGADVSLVASLPGQQADEVSLGIRRCCSNAATEVDCDFGPSGAVLTLNDLPAGPYTVSIETLFTRNARLDWTSSVPLIAEGGDTCSSPPGSISQRPVLHVKILQAATDPDGDAVQYRYTWTSDGNDSPVVHGPKTALEDVLQEGDGGASFDSGELWRVSTVPVDSGGLEGPASVMSFQIAEGRMVLEGFMMR